MAAHLFIQPGASSQEDVNKWMHTKPKAVAAFFKHIITDPERAAELAAAVEADPMVIEVSDANGKRAVDLACKECKKAMQASLYLLGRFEVDAGPPDHISPSFALLGCSDVSNPDARPLPRKFLKVMRDEGAVLIAALTK